MFVHEQGIVTRHNIGEIWSVCNLKDENMDFFTNCLSIKLKERQRALKMLNKKISSGDFKHCLKTVENVLMPLVDYLVFGGKTQILNTRDTISYDKDQKLNTLDEGLSIYTSYAG